MMIKAQNLSAGHADTRRDNQHECETCKNAPGDMSFDCQAKSSLLLKFFWKPQAKDKLLGKA